MNLTPTEKVMFRELCADHKEMKMALLGNADMEVEGLVQRLKKVEKKTSNHEKALWITTGFIMAWQAFKNYFGHG